MATESLDEPEHTHGARATSAPVDSLDATGKLLGFATPSQFSIIPYGQLNTPQPLMPAALGNAGAGQGHQNMQPYLGLNFIIALQGIFPAG